MKDDNNIFEDRMKEFLEDSKLEVSKNFEYRVMQQIKTEKALKKKPVTTVRPMFNAALIIMVIMYAALGLLALHFYNSGGWDALFDISFYIPAIGVALICSAYGLISVLDEKRNL